MYAYSDFEVFQSEIQETFKLKFDDIYFWLDNAINLKIYMKLFFNVNIL